MNKVSYKELTIGFLVIMVFFLSVSVGYLSHRTDKMDTRLQIIEQTNK